MNVKLELRNAVIESDIDTVESIIDNNNVSAELIENEILIYAVKFGHIDIVKLLLSDKNVNPAALENTCCFFAYKRSNLDILKLLYSDLRVKNSLINEHPSINQFIVKMSIKEKLANF